MLHVIFRSFIASHPLFKKNKNRKLGCLENSTNDWLSKFYKSTYGSETFLSDIE